MVVPVDVLGLLSLDGGLAVFHIHLDDRARLLCHLLGDKLFEVLVLELMMVLILSTIVVVVLVLPLGVLRAQMQPGRFVPDGVLQHGYGLVFGG